jgi:predicted GNAT family acetyltransferase
MSCTFQASTNISYNYVLKKVEHFTFPPIKKKASVINLHEPFTGVWALDGERMVGLALSHKIGGNQAELFSFYVLPEYRNKGIGKRLLYNMQVLLKDKNIKKLNTLFRDDWQSIKWISRLLEANKWHPPELLRVISEISIKKYYDVSWPRISMPNHYSIMSLGQLSEVQSNQLKEFTNKQDIPNEFKPLNNTESICKPASMVFCYKERVVGWNIVYQIGAEKLEYNNLYILKEFRKLGYALSLLHASFGVQYQLQIPLSTWVVNADNTPMMKISESLASDFRSKKVLVFTSSIAL